MLHLKPQPLTDTKNQARLERAIESEEERVREREIERRGERE